MSAEILLFLCFAIVLIAFLYSSVGHAGASGYIAVMALFGLAPAVIKSTALMLNILVAGIATWQFWKAGYFSWNLFFPFALSSVPFAFLGGYISLPSQIFKVVIGAVLLYSAFYLFLKTESKKESRLPSKPIAVLFGAGIGFLSGLVGVGGGIFLTPLLILMNWSKAKTASAVSALFILVNSVAGLAGNVTSNKELPSFAIPLALSAVAGGGIGSYVGSRRLSPGVIKKLLAVVLFIAGIKLILF